MGSHQNGWLAHPFDALVPGMMRLAALEETVEVIRGIVQRGSKLYLFVNNRFGGNAPLLAQQIAREFLASAG